MSGGSDTIKLILLIAALALATWAYAAINRDFDAFGESQAAQAPIEDSSQGR
jgi:hypothetical protein